MDHEREILESMLNQPQEAKSELPTLTKFANLPQRQLLTINSLKPIVTKHGPTAIAIIEPFKQPEGHPKSCFHIFIPGSVLRQIEVFGVNRRFYLVIDGQKRTKAGHPFWDARVRPIDDE